MIIIFDFILRTGLWGLFQVENYVIFVVFVIGVLVSINIEILWLD